MSAVMILRDPDPDRRREGIAAAEAAMSRLGLQVSSIEHGVIGLVWGAVAGAPVQQAPGAFVMGDVIPGPGSERLTAREYAERCAEREPPPAFDGVHVAVTFDDRGALTVAVDILGNLQAYTAEVGERLFVATSPALITVQPGFATELDPLGVTGLLIINGSFRGRTPLRGIRRLAPGHAVVAAPGGPLRELRHHTVEISDACHDVPAEESALRLHDALVLSTKRHIPLGIPHTMLLSGGLDSRLVIGLLVGQGIQVEAITRGEPTDLEYRCARGVARRLGVPHRLVRHGEGSFEQFERSIWWDGMATAPGSARSDWLGETLRDLRPWIVSGYLGDSTIGGGPAGKAFDRTARRASAEHYIRRMNAWGVPLDALSRLMRRDVFADGMQTVLDELRRDFMETGDTFMARAWLFDLGHRQRAVMGRMFGRLTFAGWPRTPLIDREVLRVAAGIPLPVLAGRRLERDMLQRFHTELARVPLDRNDPDTTPMLPGAMDLIRAGIDRRIRRFRERVGLPRPERRYYHRTFDFNGAPWRRVRLGAAADRERLYDLFDRDALDAYLPAAESTWQPTGKIEGAAGVKMLTALGVWLRVGLS